MKNSFLIFILLIIVVSCSDEPTEPDIDSRFQTVFGIERVLEDFTSAGVIGDITADPCEESEIFHLSVAPNPTNNRITVMFNVGSTKTVEAYLETALSSEEFKDSLSNGNISTYPRIIDHSKYKKEMIFNSQLMAGTFSFDFDLGGYDAGAYIITIKDDEGNTTCKPLIISRVD